MGVLTPVIERAALAMFHAGEHLALGGTVALQLIRDDHTRHRDEALEQRAKALLRGPLITPTLYQDIEDVAVLIHSPP